MRFARIYPWRRTRRSRAPSNGPDAFFVAQFSAGYTTNMFGFNLRQGRSPQSTLLASTTSESWLPMDSDISQRSNCNASPRDGCFHLASDKLGHGVGGALGRSEHPAAALHCKFARNTDPLRGDIAS